MAVTISADDARTSEGRGERRETLVFSLVLPTLTCRPLYGLFALTAGGGHRRATSQSSVPMRDLLRCLYVMRGKDQPQSSREGSAFFTHFKCVELERLEQLEIERPEIEAEERALPSATGCVFLPASNPDPPISDFYRWLMLLNLSKPGTGN